MDRHLVGESLHEGLESWSSPAIATCALPRVMPQDLLVSKESYMLIGSVVSSDLATVP